MKRRDKEEMEKNQNAKKTILFIKKKYQSRKA